MKIQYLEIVTDDIEQTCAAHSAIFGADFSEPVEMLGNARTLKREDGSIVGVRATLSDEETPIVRPYWLVTDIEYSIEQAESAGGQVLHPPLELTGYGTFAIYMLGSVQYGLWQL